MRSIAGYIEEHKETILDRWYEAASKAASARGLDRPELVNHLLRTYLTSLAEMGPSESALEHRRSLIEVHFSKRLRAGFDVAEINEEFVLLGRCIADSWAQEPPATRPGATEVSWLFTELHRATNDITELFSVHMRENEQAEKRWLRLLETRAHTMTVRERAAMDAVLDALIRVVAEAVAADSVTLHLFERAQARLVARASVGIADEMVEPVAVDLGRDSFLGQVADNEETTTLMLDVTTTDLEISDALRESGIRSMLGIRLPSRQELLGVMTVGRRDPKGFSVSERRRLEALGDRLSLHLDNLRLLEKLELNIDELRVEREHRERFVAMLAHDLRSPLSAAKMFARVLYKEPGTAPRCRELAANIDVNINRTDRMVRDLLDVARLHAGGTIPLQLESVPLAALFDSLVEELRAAHGPRFVVEAEAGVEGCWDGEVLRRALWNLATNAIKYGDTDSPVTLRGRQRDGRVTITVHNQGKCLSSEARAQVFEPFVQVSQDREERAGGWGLGLASVRACAQAHGGEVSVESSEGKGTVFTLELPLDAGAVVA